MGRSSQALGMCQGSIRLKANHPHFLEWKRGPGGSMNVALDGRPVIDAADTDIRNPFNGFLMVKSSGSCGIRSIAIAGANWQCLAMYSFEHSRLNIDRKKNTGT